MELAEKGGQTMSVLLSITKTRSRLRHTLLHTAPVLHDALNGFSTEREESRNCDWIQNSSTRYNCGIEALCLPCVQMQPIAQWRVRQVAQCSATKAQMHRDTVPPRQVYW